MPENGEPKKGIFIDLKFLGKVLSIVAALAGTGLTTTGVNQFLTKEKVETNNQMLIQSLALEIANDEELMDYIYFKMHQREQVAHPQPQPAATVGHEEALREPINAMTSPLFAATPNQPVDTFGPQLEDSTRYRLEDQSYKERFEQRTVKGDK